MAAPQSRTPSDLILNIGGPGTPAPAPVAPVPAPVPQQQPDLDAILRTLGAQTIAAQPVSTQPPRGMMMDGTYKGKDVTIYSIGDSRTEQDFNTALAQYNASGKTPPGYTVLEPGMMSSLRSGFETVRKPLRQAVEQLDEPGSPVNQLPAPLTTAAKFVTRTVADQVKTPERLGLLVGTIAAAPLLGPAAAGSTFAGKLALPAIKNAALRTAAGAGIGGAAADVATGERINPSQLGVEMGMVALGSGFQGLISHAVNKYVRPDLQQKVMGDIVDAVTTKYPALKNNPNVIEIGASSGDTLVKMGEQMANAFRGSPETIASTLLADIKTTLPGGVPVGTQNTLRKHLRHFAQAGNDMLDSVNDPKAFSTARDAYNQATKDIGELVKGEVAQFVQTKGGDPLNVARNVSGILDRNRVAMNQFEDGMQAVSYMNKAYGDSGFSLMKLRNNMLDSYGGNPGQLTREVRNILGGSTVGVDNPSILNLPQYTESIENPKSALLNAVKRNLPLPDFLKNIVIPGGTTKSTVSTLPYQMPQPLPPALNIGSQLAGQEALRSFMDRK